MNDTTQTTTVENSIVPPEGSAENFANLPTAPVFHPSVLVANGQIRVNSRQVADDFGKRHDDVLKKYRDLDCSEDFNRRNFAVVEYIDAKGEARPMVEMTRDGFMFLTSRFTGPRAAQILEAYIAEFNRMEALLRGDGAHAQLAAMMQTMQALATEVVALRRDLQGMVQTQQTRLLESQAKLIELLERHQKQPRRRLKALTPEAHATIVELLAQGMPGAEVARIVECSEATVSLIKHGRYQHSGHALVPRRENGQMPLIPEVEADAPLD